MGSVALMLPSVVLDEDLPASVDQIAAGDPSTMLIVDIDVHLRLGQPGLGEFPTYGALAR